MTKFILGPTLRLLWSKWSYSKSSSIKCHRWHRKLVAKSTSVPWSQVHWSEFNNWSRTSNFLSQLLTLLNWYKLNIGIQRRICVYQNGKFSKTRSVGFGTIQRLWQNLYTMAIFRRYFRGLYSILWSTILAAHQQGWFDHLWDQIFKTSSTWRWWSKYD